MQVCGSVIRFIPNFGTTFMGVVRFKLRPFYRRSELSLYPLNKRLGGALCLSRPFGGEINVFFPAGSRTKFARLQSLSQPLNSGSSRLCKLVNVAKRLRSYSDFK
jgi:hypothetical protein